MCCELLLPPLGDLCLDGELALWVDGTLADFLQRLAVGIARRQGLANGTGLLLAQIQRLVLLVLEHLAQILLLLLVHHNVDASDGLAYNAAAIAKTNIISPIGTPHTYTHNKLLMLLLFLTYILESLDGAPPVTLATRRLSSSFLSSSNCLVSSFLSLVLNSEHLTFT